MYHSFQNNYVSFVRDKDTCGEILKIYKNMPKDTLIEQMFAELMPEVKFVDCAPTTDENIAGGARKKLEARLGHSVVSKKNFLKNPENKKRLK